jgi:hypothetical protein
MGEVMSYLFTREELLMLTLSKEAHPCPPSSALFP